MDEAVYTPMLEEDFVSKVKELVRLSETCLPEDILEALMEAYKNEDSDLPKMQLQAMLENAKIAREKSLPICQDTGLITFYVSVGEEFQLPRWFVSSLKRAVFEISEEMPLRPNVVKAIDRLNVGNVGRCVPIVLFEQVPGESIELTVLPKGAGSENMSYLAMLKPSEGLEGIRKVVLSHIQSCGGQPCPPTVVGVGIGGCADLAMKLAKKALLRDLGEANSDPQIARLEERLKEEANALGIGAMGLGGRTTVLGVKIEVCDTHVACLPVAINVNCWAARKAKLVITPKGEFIYERRK
jgi:fumarate hydratase subunit alpha